MKISFLTILAGLSTSAVSIMTPVMAQDISDALSPTEAQAVRPSKIISAPEVKKPRKGSLGSVQPDLRLTVLHNNDGETNLLPIASGAATGAGGIARFVTLVNQQKAAATFNPGDGITRGVVMISSGDNSLPGSQFDANDVRPSGTPTYDSRAFQLIGYDAITLGNHDFDSGPGPLAEIISGLNVPPSGPFISANLNFASEPLLAGFTTGPSPKLTRSIVRNVAGRQVGIVGATTSNLPFISSPGPNIVINLAVASAMQAEIDALDAAGVKIIIVSTHLQGFSTEIATVAQLRKVDAVISGGGSELFASPGDTLLPGDVADAGGPAVGGTAYPRFISDADGNQIPAVTTAGLYRYLGQMVLDFDAQGNLLGIFDDANATRPIPVTAAITPDPTAVATIETPVAAYVAGLASNIVANTSVFLDGRTVSGTVGVRAQEINVGNLFADSLLWQATVLASQLGTPVPDVALQSGGGIRNSVTVNAGGQVSELTLSRMAAFNNIAAIVPNVSAQTLKDIMENAVSKYPTTTDNGRFAQISGMRVEFDPTRQAFTITTNIATGVSTVTNRGERIRSITLSDGRVLVSNGQVVANAPAVNIATIDFLVQTVPTSSPVTNPDGLGNDQYPWGRNVSFVRLGVSYRRALSNYIRQWLGGNINPTNYPTNGELRLINLSSPTGR